MEDGAYERILAEVLRAEEGGREVDRQDLLARFPGQEGVVLEVLEDVQRYREMRQAAAGPAPPVELPPGTRLGDFEVAGPLGRGGMGTVYRARQVTLDGRQVALKVLRVGASGERARARFRREATTLAGLHHPHLAAVHGFGEHDGHLYYAMRLVEGPNLREVLERRASATRSGANDSADERRSIVRRIAEIADALAAVHAAGLVHRDVKPANVVFEDGDAADALQHSAVLVDFGLVRSVGAESVTRTGDSPATPSYAPPEQLLGQEVDARADVFSLGVTLHDLLAARTPHERMQASAGLAPLHELVPGIDADLTAVVAHAVDPDPRWRYANATELRDDLVAWLQGWPVRARQTPWPERTRRWIRRHPRRVVQSVVGLFVVAGLLAGGVLGSAATARVQSVGAAWDLQDLPTFAREMREVPGSAFHAWLLPQDREVVFQRLEDGQDGDPLARARGAMEAGDPGGALTLVARSVAERGFGEDLPAERFLITAIQRRADPGQTRGGRAWATAAAMLFNQRLVTTPQDLAATADLRDALLEAWGTGDEDLDRFERRSLLSALAGCAPPAALPGLLSWSRTPGKADEDRRLALRCAERTLRRSIGTGELDRIDFDALWEELTTQLAEWDGRWLVGGDDTLPFDCENTLWLTFRALLIAQRLRQGPLPPITSGGLQSSDGRLCIDPRRCAIEFRLETYFLIDPAFVIQSVLPLLRDPPPGDPDNLAELRGRLTCLAEWLSDDAVQLPSWVARNDSDESLGKFDQGYRREEKLLEGIDIERDPTSDRPADSSIGERSAGSGDLPEVSGPLPTSGSAYSRRAGAFARGSLERPAGEAPLASWILSPGGALLGEGNALVSARARYVSGELLVEGEDNNPLLLDAPGVSELQLALTPPGKVTSSGLLLAIGLQSSLRAYLPQFGIARVEIWVNDQLADVIATAHINALEFNVQLYTHWLLPGENHLAIRLASDSETSVRIHWLELWRYAP